MSYQSFDQSSVQRMNALTGPKPRYTTAPLRYGAPGTQPLDREADPMKNSVPGAAGGGALQFVGLAELLGDDLPLPEVIEHDSSEFTWLAWDMAVEAQDARARR